MKFCPHCGGDISAYMAAERGDLPTTGRSSRPVGGKYDQDATWRRLVQEGEALKANPPEAMALVSAAVDRVKSSFVDGKTISTIVHLAMDRDIQPQGGLLFKATMLEGRMTTDPKQLENMGYAVRDDKLVTVNDSPVSHAYMAIDYWGGAKQHKRWHLAKPVVIEASRNGNPFFMDENMIAFGAQWRDVGKMEAGLLDLHETLSCGVKKNGCIGIPVAIEIVVQ